MSTQTQTAELAGCFTVGEDVSVKGRFSVPERAVINGSVEGEITAREPGDAAPSEEQMHALADSIRQRNGDIRRFVDRSLTSIDGENGQLHDALRGSGLTEQAIRVIQLSMPVGGYTEALPVGTSLGRVEALARVIAKNPSLRGVLGAMPDHLPLDSPRVSSGFGPRGTVILAAVGQELGNVVIVRHSGGIETLYGHMASISVREGDEVTEKSVLGIVGNTGSASTGRHLHFEVTVGGYPVKPLKVIQTAQNVRKIETKH